MLRFASLAAATAIGTLLFLNDPGTRVVTIDQPSERADLHHDGVGVAMRYHFVDGQMEVIASFQDGRANKEIILRMDDGESLSFALPGHDGSLYSFTRRGDALTAQVKTTSFSEAARAG
ncbi:MAG: hypothetical protein AAF557_15580 [Pseudomonadota bacterium]